MKKKLLILIFISILLTSCLEVDSLIDLKEDGTGIWNLNGKQIKTDTLVSMNTSIRHRGPDDEGFWDRPCVRRYRKENA